LECSATDIDRCLDEVEARHRRISIELVRGKEVVTVSSPLPRVTACGVSATIYESFTVRLVIAYLDKPAFESQAALNLPTVGFVNAVMVDRPP
jgi:hypothetical protein